MAEKILYHGSVTVIQNPEYGKGNRYNDYGLGFYCTENLALAREWAVTGTEDGYVNEYVLQTDGLAILNLSSPEYTILHWLTLLLKHRTLQRSTPVAKRAIEFLTENYLPDISGYDAIIGYRADDSYFSFARAFVGNEISLMQLGYAMRLGKLGEQFVLKSERSFSRIRFVKSEKAERVLYYRLRKERDASARAAFQAELDKEDVNGLFMRDIIRERIMPDDARIR